MIKRYNIHSLKNGEGWAILVIDTEIGFFATISAWGNYAYLWSNPGKEFRSFLMGLDNDYLCKKLMHGRPDARELDVKATREAIFQGIEEKNAGIIERKRQAWPRYDEERRSAACIDDIKSFEVWESETSLDEPWEYKSMVPNRQAMSFCKNVWPQFVKLLEEEIAVEEKEDADAVKLRALAPALLEEVVRLLDDEVAHGE